MKERWGLIGWVFVIAWELLALALGFETFSERAQKWYREGKRDIKVLMWGFMIWLPLHWFLPWFQQFKLFRR